jgi:hypothetical protein
MQLALLICGAFNLLAQSASGQAETNFTCVVRLQVPRYPRLALFAQIDGTITATVRLSKGATVGEIATNVESKLGTKGSLLTPSVEDAVQKATFRSDCGGKTVRLIFIFEITGQPSAEPKEIVTFGFPNKFWITSEPHKAIVD